MVSEESFVTLLVGQRLKAFVARGIVFHFESEVRRWNRELMFDQRQGLERRIERVLSGSDSNSRTSSTDVFSNLKVSRVRIQLKSDTCDSLN